MGISVSTHWKVNIQSITYAIQGKRQTVTSAIILRKQNSGSVASFSSISWSQELELVSVHRTKPLLILD